MTPPRDPAFPVITPRSSTAAYRADLAGRAGTFGQHDGAWVAVASLLEHAALLAEPDRSRLLIDAIEFARELIGEDRLERLGEREWQDRDRAPAEAILLLTETVHRAGALNLTIAILHALLGADSSLNDVQRGRIIAQRARVFRKLGLVDEANEDSRVVARLGRHAKSEELRVRASLGYATSAQLRGNYPEMYRHTQRAARLAARAGLTILERDARNGLMIALGATRRFDEALVNGWKVYQASIGDPVDEGEALQNIGQLLFESGHLAEARAGFAAVVTRELPAHMILPALGGLAMTSAATGYPKLVEWAAAEIERAAPAVGHRYSIASALLEAAMGLRRIGQTESSERHRKAAIEIARTHAFHEIVFRAEAMETATDTDAARRTLTAEAATVANQVAWLEPKQLPEHVALAVASS